MWGLVVVAAVALAAPGAVGAQPPPPSVLDERPGTGRTAPSDPALRARFLAEYLAAPPGGARGVIEVYLPTLGVTGILDALEERFASCHGRAHEVGKAAYARSRDMAGVLGACQARCGGGCMHGVVMEAFTEAPGGLRARVARLCEEDAFRRGYKKGDCAHGVGHGAAYVASYDMDEGVVEKLAEFDEALARRVCAELRGRTAEVCREAARNRLYAPKKAGFEHYFAGR